MIFTFELFLYFYCKNVRFSRLVINKLSDLFIYLLTYFAI